MNNKALIDNIKTTGKYELFKNILSNKNYNELYTIFGKNIYNLFTPSDFKKKDIEELMNNNDLGTIYNKYGSIKTLFIKNFRRRKKEDIKRLLSDKRYIELFNKYGEQEFKEHIIKIKENDIEYESGSKFKAKLYANKNRLGIGIKKCLDILAVTTISMIMMLSYESYVYINNSYKEALINNSELIAEYDEKITNYASSINNLELDSDIDVVMKVMYDMWNEMEGYGTPTLDENSLGRLAFTHENGVGVCRNIADDFSARMNAINPEYNARNLAVYITNEYELANIERTLVENNSTETNDDTVVDSIIDKLEIEKLIGNHMVSIFEPIGKDYTLVVDPTNPSIGIINNGKIYMFSTKDGSGLQFKPLGQMATILNYDYDDVNKEFDYHFFGDISEEKLDKLISEWGLDAQNNALAKIENIESKQK